MQIKTALLSLCIAVSPSLADAADDGARDEQLGLSFSSLYEPTQENWRVTVPDDSPVLVSRTVEDDSGQLLGFLWVKDELASTDLGQWLDEHVSILDQLGLSVGRSTALRDGGIDGARASLGSDTLAGYTERNGEFDLYDIQVRVGSIGSERVGMDFVTGLRAVRARVGHTRNARDAAGTMRTTLDLGRGVVAIPIVGTGVHWQPNDSVRFSGAATTHTISDQATYYDFSAEAEIRIMSNVGLIAGYQYVRSVMEVRNVPAELNEGGLFARIQIKF
jgi:hypothetical protein